MMLCDVRSSALVSEPTVCVVLRSLSGLLRGAVEVDESEERNGTWTLGDLGRGVISVDGISSGTASTMVGESGAMACFS